MSYEIGPTDEGWAVWKHKDDGSTVKVATFHSTSDKDDGVARARARRYARYAYGKRDVTYE